MFEWLLVGFQTELRRKLLESETVATIFLLRKLNSIAPTTLFRVLKQNAFIFVVGSGLALIASRITGDVRAQWLTTDSHQPLFEMLKNNQECKRKFARSWLEQDVDVAHGLQPTIAVLLVHLTEWVLSTQTMNRFFGVYKLEIVVH